MILSDKEILEEIVAGNLVFEPSVTGRISSSTVDLLLHPDLITFPATDLNAPPVNPAQPGFRVVRYLNENGNKRSLRDDPYTFDPGRMIIGKTTEYIKLPPDLAARIEGRSSLARLGLSVHITAPTVLAGFEGTLYLEMYNWGYRPIQLRENMRIAQLIIERVGTTPLQPYHGEFHRQE